MKRMWSRNELKRNVEEVASSGNLPSVKANEIIENMSGYSFTLAEPTGYTLEKVYVGAVKNGNKLTLVIAFNITRNEDDLSGGQVVGDFTLPENVYNKLIETRVGSNDYLDNQVRQFWSNGWTNKSLITYLFKTSGSKVRLSIDSAINSTLVKATKYYCRYETTFLLSESL